MQTFFGFILSRMTLAFGQVLVLLLLIHHITTVEAAHAINNSLFLLNAVNLTVGSSLPDLACFNAYNESLNMILLLCN